jgi:hypothetical protein
VIRRTANLGASYPELVDILLAASKQRTCPAPWSSTPSRPPAPSTTRSRSRRGAPIPRKTPPSSGRNRTHPNGPACSIGFRRRAIAERNDPHAGEIDRISPAFSPSPPQPAPLPHPPQADPAKNSAREGDLYLTHLKVPGRAVRKIVLTVRSATARRRRTDLFGGPDRTAPRDDSGGRPVPHGRDADHGLASHPRPRVAARGHGRLAGSMGDGCGVGVPSRRPPLAARPPGSGRAASSGREGRRVAWVKPEG